MMKKLISAMLAMTMMLSLAACSNGNNGGNTNDNKDNQVTDTNGSNTDSGDTNGADNGTQAKDINLQAYYDDFMSSLGEGNTPAMTPLEGEMIDNFYEGLSAIETKQMIVEMASISAVAYEFALIEVANESDVETVKGILQARIDAQVNGGAFYPETVEAWEKADILVNGNIVALILAGEQQADAVDAFNALFA